MGQSDFHRRTSTEYRLSVPVAAPHAIVKGGQWISRFSCLVVLYVLGFSDSGEPSAA